MEQGTREFNLNQGHPLKVLVVDVGGTNVKVLATGQKEPRKFPSGPKADSG
jgi:hypothetical protein